LPVLTESGDPPRTQQSPAKEGSVVSAADDLAKVNS
jgi:hypothetical protein